MAICKYFVDGENSNLYEYEPVREFDCNDHDEMDSLVKDIAEDYHYEHGGWEADYPIEITLIYNDIEIDTFSVDMEHVPAFSISRISDD